MSDKRSPQQVKEDLSRKWFLDMDAVGHVFIRRRGARIESGCLPVFTPDTEDQAKHLQIFNCRLARDASGLYTFNDFKAHDLNDLERTACVFRDTYEKHNQRDLIRCRLTGESVS